MKRFATCVPAIVAAGFLLGCGGGGEMSESLPDRGTIYRTGTVTDLVALGARKLSEDEFRSEIVGKRLRNTGDVDEGARRPGEGWIWKIGADGTSRSWSDRGTDDWQAESTWTFENGQYCRNRVGDTDAPGCSSVYELNGVYRFTGDEPDGLAGWSVEVGGWDAGQLLHDGETLTARHVAGVLHDKEDGTTALRDFDFSIGLDGNGRYVVTMAGLEHTFTEAEIRTDGRGSARSGEDHEMSFWHLSGRHDEIVAGHSMGEHFLLFETMRDMVRPGSDPELWGYVLVGNPTSGLGAMRDVTATYDGFGLARIDLYPARGYEGRDQRDTYWGDATLTADFGNSTISGRLHDFTVQRGGEDGRAPVEGLVMTVPVTAFDAASFSGDFEVSGLGADESLAASYEGSFYGVDAPAVFGTISGTGRFDGAPANAIGFFAACETRQCSSGEQQ